MAILEVKRRYIREADLTLEDREYVETFFVKTDSKQHTPREIALAAGVPRRGDPHPEDEFSICDSVVPDLADNSDRHWVVRCHYSVPEGTQPVSGDDEEAAQQPDAVIPRIQIRYVSRTEPLVKDVTGRPLLNSAGARFVDVPEVDRDYTELIISGRVRFENFDLDTSARYRNRINDGPFLNNEARTCRMINIDASTEDAEFRQQDGRILVRTVWNISILVHIRDSWDIEIVDEGHYENSSGVTGLIVVTPTSFSGLNITYDNFRPIEDADGNAIQEPVFLDGNGNRLGSGQQPVFIPFFPYETANFSDLLDQFGFPQTLAGYKVEFYKEEP